MLAWVSGGAAGTILGYVLQRGNLCFHSAWRGVIERRPQLFSAWLLGVAIASVGLAGLYAVSGSDLNRGLAFTPVGNVAGGVLIGVGMVVAATCASGLFVKLGSGMLGGLVGIAGWALGEYAVRDLDLRGPQVLAGGDPATVAAVVGVPRIVPAVALLAGAVGVVVLVRRRDDASVRPPWQWGAPLLGTMLGAATLVSWALADLGDATFGPSTVGAVRALAAGAPAAWLTAFLGALVLGSLIAARTAGGLFVRGEPSRRYVGLAIGGFLLGSGGWIAGGCNLGHGLSGTAQLNVSSWVVVASIIGGIALARTVTASWR